MLVPLKSTILPANSGLLEQTEKVLLGTAGLGEDDGLLLESAILLVGACLIGCFKAFAEGREQDLAFGVPLECSLPAREIRRSFSFSRCSSSRCSGRKLLVGIGLCGASRRSSSSHSSSTSASAFEILGQFRRWGVKGGLRLLDGFELVGQPSRVSEMA